MASPVRDSEWLAWLASLMGGTPRHTCASTYPPDRFYCLLDELPLHLVPQRLTSSLRLRHGRKEEFVINPECQILRGGQVPTEFASCRDLLDKFALQGTVAWVRDPAFEVLSPFWLGPGLESALLNLNSESAAAKLSDTDVDVLLCAGILRKLQDGERYRERRRSETARSAEMFKQCDYVPVSNLIHPFHVAALRRYYRYMIRRRNIYLGDNQSSRRYVAHNESVVRFFHHQIARIVSAVAGEPVKPSYVYLASYLSGAELKKHTDREQCEFSVTLCLDFSPEPTRETPWPIRLDTRQGTTTVFQSLGDGLVYRGTRVPHYRYALPQGHTSTSIFFHYVPLDFSGPLN